MVITPEESEAYNAALRWADCDAYNTVNKAVYLSLILALRRHVAAEMRLEWEAKHLVPHPYKTDADWDRAADEALRGGKSDG